MSSNEKKIQQIKNKIQASGGSLPPSSSKDGSAAAPLSLYSRFMASYGEKTPSICKLLDSFLVCTVISGVIQFVYMLIMGRSLVRSLVRSWALKWFVKMKFYSLFSILFYSILTHSLALYCIVLLGTFPYNAFLSGFATSCGMFCNVGMLFFSCPAMFFLVSLLNLNVNPQSL